MITNPKNIQNLHQDCKYFITDRPCIFHKKYGNICENCNKYSPIKTRILIIKLDAIGDVLRTTFILAILKQKYKNAHITWITSKNSEPVLKNNEFIDRIFTTDNALLPIYIKNQKFDVSINVDLSSESLTIADFVKAKEKFGFVYKNNKVVPLNSAGENMFAMSMSDFLKKKNAKTYQQIISDICELKYEKNPIIVPLTKRALEFAEKFKFKNKLTGKNEIIGLNIGSGSRWKTKRWDKDSWKKLTDILLDKGFNVIIFAGPQEQDLEKEMKLHNKNLVSAGCDNSIEEFFGLLNLVDILITGDTMALHAGLGLGKKIVALFGPTSQNEIEMYDQGIKLAPQIDCLCCYKTDCSKKCIANLSANDVYKNIRGFLK